MADKHHSKIVDIIDVTAKNIRKAFHSEFVDFEDELICVCAEHAKIDCIITSNTKDFKNSSIPAITPEDLLTNYYNNL